MDAAGDISIWKWLAELLGPGGFVAALAAGAEAWFIFKLYGCHRDERKEFHATCKVERDEWAKRLDQMEADKTLKQKQSRADIKGQYKVINAVHEVMTTVNGFLERLTMVQSNQPRKPSRRG